MSSMRQNGWKSTYRSKFPGTAAMSRCPVPYKHARPRPTKWHNLRRQQTTLLSISLSFSLFNYRTGLFHIRMLLSSLQFSEVSGGTDEIKIVIVPNISYRVICSIFRLLEPGLSVQTIWTSSCYYGFARPPGPHCKIARGRVCDL